MQAWAVLEPEFSIHSCGTNMNMLPYCRTKFKVFKTSFPSQNNLSYCYDAWNRITRLHSINYCLKYAKLSSLLATHCI